jgi:hypothetical protein
MMPPTSDFGFFRIEFRANDEDDYPAFPDTNYFLHDLNLLYEFSRVIVDPKYRGYRFSRFFTYRNRRRIDADDQLRIERLTQQSPLYIATVVAALPATAATIWIGVQIFEKIANFSLNREILKLNRDKLRRELAQPLGQGQADIRELTEDSFRQQVHIREAEYIYDRIENHLRDNPIRIREIEVAYVRELPKKIEEEK